MKKKTTPKRTYTKTLKWEVVDVGKFSGLTEAMAEANQLLKTGARDEVRVRRITSGETV